MRIARTLLLIGAASAAVQGWPTDGAGAALRHVVLGTGDPNLDVAAVQAAVDQGGEVLLRGHFSFDKPPAMATPAQTFFPRMASVVVSKEVVISGDRDSLGEMTRIDGGTWPFAVEAPGAHVSIQGLRFVRPAAGAIEVNAVRGLAITDCRIEGIRPIPSEDMRGAGVSLGIGISTVSKPPTPALPGRPEDISGTISILNNEIDASGGTTKDMTVGILIFSAGRVPDRAADVYVSGNRIRNVTERAVNIRQLGGSAHIERNIIETGAVVGASGGAAPEAIHVFGSGSFLVARNSIQCDWGAGAGIRVHGGFEASPVTGALVLENDISMAGSAGAVFGANSAAIEIRGFARDNVVLNNRVRGSARAALALVARETGAPGNNRFVSNDLAGFRPSEADLSVDAGVRNTLFIGPKAKVQDGGIDTVIVKLGGNDK